MSTPAPLQALILAAGRSTRLGAFKPLLPLNGMPILDRCVAFFRAAGLEDITVVAGHRADEVLEASAGLGVRGIANTGYDAGMLSSIQTGLAALPPCRAALVLPVDTPLVRPATLLALLEKWSGDPDPERVVVPAFLGQPGHPALVGAAHFPAIARWEGPDGLRGYLARHAPMELLAVEDAGAILDVDTPDDLRRAQELADSAR